MNNDNVIYLGLGSNLGNRFLNIKNAIFNLSNKMTVLEISSIDETDPVGHLDQPKFLNCVVKCTTKLELNDLLVFVKDLEIEMGRKPSFENGPRLIDIDVLFYNNDILRGDRVIVPHPRAHERKFVLKPMSEISPDFIHPVYNKTMEELFVDIGS